MKKDKRLPCLLISDRGKTDSTNTIKSPSPFPHCQVFAWGSWFLDCYFWMTLGTEGHSSAACSEFVYFSFGSFLRGATLSMTINLCLDIFF